MQSAKHKNEAIEVRGARVHNLKNISFTLPINQMIVVTGVSGSGKSSLAFDTIYAEGQRRYVESLSAYARQFLERMDKPDVDEIIGIAPAIAIRQKNSTRNPRSTVATQTEIYDYLRLLFARVGQTFCEVCGDEVKSDSPESAADDMLAKLDDGERFYLLFPAMTEDDALALKTIKSAGPVPHLMSLMQRGFTRLYRNGEVIDLRTPEDFKFKDFKDTFVLVDRLKADSSIRTRLVDSLESCFRESSSATVISADAPDKTFTVSERFICKKDLTIYEQPEPRLFSFNSPFGACPTCQGFGNTIDLDFNLVVPNDNLSIAEGAIDPFTKNQYSWAQGELLRFCAKAKISTKTPFAKLSASDRNKVLEGTDGWIGVRGFFDHLEKKKYKLHVRVFLSKYRGYTACRECDGGRLRKEARAVKIGEMSLPEVVAMSIKDADSFFNDLELTEEREKVAEKLLAEIRRRIRFLMDVGLDYLTLARLASTLSGGEAQRIQLATNLGSLLVGALYVLDEPSIGLHPRDNSRLVKILQNLRDIGNTVLVVEHDEETMRAADKILDIGVYAGELGGELVYEGDLKGLLACERSLTSRYLNGEVEIAVPAKRKPKGKKSIVIRGARENNLKDVDVEIPLEMMVCITGVSGSGKSTLVHDILYAGVKKKRGEWQGHVGNFTDIAGIDNIDDIVLVDQSPIGRTPRSNPVTYIKAYDQIREVFAGTQGAKSKRFTASHFSFNIAGGRCETCQGSGTVVVEMQFLADVELTCEDCNGTRFRADVLDVKYKGKSIAEVLNLTVREAISFFKEVPRLISKLKVIDGVGLGYLRLGQSATTLSGGEAQRVKLAAHLAQKSKQKTLFIFDEPTTGLHFDDINKLLVAFRALIDSGGSLVVIEHNMDVVKTADHVIDLGPEGGVNGGQIVATGTPEQIVKTSASITGKFLKGYLKK